MLIGENLWKRYAEKEVLRGVNLTITPGGITVVIGPSGSGKTTLLRAMAMLDPPTSGRIEIDGTTYEFSSDGSARGPRPWPMVTAVFQQLFLWPHLTLRQNITLPLRMRRSPIVGSRKLDELVDLFEMGEFIDRFPNEVSLGQRQRAAIARALVLEPKYVLLDEVTSALDVEQVSKVLGQLQLLRGSGIGIMLITHLIGFARRAADHVLFLDEGEVVESGPPTILDETANERVHRFLSMIHSAT
jgi:polar amino acid transport system ATP-binding protein